MTDTSTADELPPQTNGVASDMDDEERARIRPADIDADVREMERRKRVELIMNSKLFREELERIIETQLKDGTGASGLLQQISDMVGVNKQAGNVFKNSSCVIPINDIRGIESMGYAKGEKILRCKLAAVFRLIDLYGWTQGANTLITARLNQEEEQFLVNPYGMLFHEITASSLIKVDMQGGVLEQGTTNFSVNVTAFSLHAAVHAARPDIRCIVHVHTPSVVAVSAIKHGLLPLSRESVVIGEISTHPYLGGWLDPDEKDKLARNLGPINKVLLLSNQGALCCGETIEETFFNARNTVLASESQLKLLPLGLDNLIVLNDEARKKIYDAAHKAPESTPRPDQPSILESKVERKWRVGGIEFEALMRMMDNAGFRTGYIYRHPLVKGEPPKPRNDVEVPPAVSSLGYLLEEEELYRQGLWKKLEGGRKGHDRSRWLNSPNVYQKVEILETGTPDPKKITKWVADASPSHSTPVRIETALQFVPQGTNPKEFKQRQQQIKDYRRADKISAGPQSHILEGVTWEEAKKMQDAAVTQTGDQVVLMGAASKGIIQRGHQHNATVYKSPYAKNPFDSVTDEELEDYKKVVEKKAKGDYDTDYSESDGLSSAHINKRMDSLHLRSPTSVTSETEEESRDEPQILRIETRTVPKASQPEVVLSDVEASPVEQFLRAERTSGNSFKNYEELPFDMLNPQLSNSSYRTNSHAGLPKGSYVVPNPVHYHIARQTQIAKTMRPAIVSLIPHTNAYYKFNDLKRQSHFVRSNNAITLSLKDAHSVAVDISMDTLKAFIYPFAKALNLVEMPLLSNQGSQTSYMTNFDKNRIAEEQRGNVEYTPLYVDRYANTLHTSDQSSSFERRILNDLQQNLVEQFNDVRSSNEDLIDGVNETVEFTERDQEEANESLADIIPDLVEALPESGSSKSSSSGKTYNVEEIQMNGEEYLQVNTDAKENGKQEDDKLNAEVEQHATPPETSPVSESTDDGSDHDSASEKSSECEAWELKTSYAINEELKSLVQTMLNLQHTGRIELSEENGLFNQDIILRRINDSLEITSVMPGTIFDFNDENIGPKNCVDLEFELEKKDKLKFDPDELIDWIVDRDEKNDSGEEKNDSVEGQDNGQEEFHSTEEGDLNQPDNQSQALLDFEGDSLVQHNTSLATNENDSFCEKNTDDAENVKEDILDQSIGHSIVEVADKFSSEFLKVVDDYEVAMDVINQVKQILNCSQNGNLSPLKSVDEGIEDPSVTVTTESANTFVDLSPNIDERVTKLGTILKDYIIEQGFEFKELLVFPELLNDQNTTKLLAKLTGVYKEVYESPLTPESKNELRLSIANYVLNLLTLDDRFRNDSNESDNLLNISDKVFTISEYISDVLDTFFEAIDAEEFSDFTKDMTDESFAQSTPGKWPKPVKAQNVEDADTTEINEYVLDDTVTSFKQDSKQASDSFWISISPMPIKQKVVPVRRTIINIDDIPLRPPADLNDTQFADGDICGPLSNERPFTPLRVNIDDIPLKPPEDLVNERLPAPFKDNTDDAPLKSHETGRNKIPLSPIREESNVNLFDSHLPPDYDISDDTTTSFDYEVVGSDDGNVEPEEHSSSEQSNLVKSSEAGASDCSTEVNIVVCNEIKFYRSKVDNNPPFTQRSNVVFTTDVMVKKTDSGKKAKDDEDKENEPLNNSGDWMGFEGENTVNGDQSDAHMSTLSQSSKEDRSISEGSPKKDKKKKKGLRTPSFLKKKKEKKVRDA